MDKKTKEKMVNILQGKRKFKVSWYEDNRYELEVEGKDKEEVNNFVRNGDFPFHDGELVDSGDILNIEIEELE